MIRLSDLCGKRVRREDGTSLGDVHEVHIQDCRVTALICGSRGMLQRFTAAHSGHRVLWEHVLKVTPAEIVIANKRK
jgi:sporulation protein YlmC with PRC-barrel domain